MNWYSKKILLTGGTGSFGQAFVSYLLSKKSFRGTIRVFSRDEFKQYQMQQKYDKDKRLRFFIGDIRELARLSRAMYEADIVIHAAALKHVSILEYNPFEAVKTNILGSQNIIESAMDSGVKKVLLISSDKAVSPVSLYGATKLVAEKIFVQANSYVGSRKTRFGVVRYGNVAASRGSIIPKFFEQAKNNTLTITDERMTRFWITLEQGVRFVINSLRKMEGGEIFVPKLPSIKIIDLVRAIAPTAKMQVIGIRPGEKLHEVLINQDEARHTRDFGNYFTIMPEFVSWGKVDYQNSGKSLEENFYYSSDNNDNWLSSSDIKKLLSQHARENDK